MKIVVGHLYPDYLNIYADRGNIAVLARRAAWRGHELDVRALSLGDAITPGEHDLLYIGGGQDREQALDRPGPRRERPPPSSLLSSTARPCSQSAVGISCSAGAIAMRRAPSCQASAFSRTRRLPGRRG